MIFFRKKIKLPVTGEEINLEERINSAVFPMLQGGPHNNTIAGIAVALKEVMDPSFKDYIVQLKKNMVALANKMMELGHSIVTNGTDNHLVLWNLKPWGLTGSKMQKMLEMANMTVNMNTLYGDSNPMAPSGIRIGSAAMTSRRLVESDFEQIAVFLHEGAQIAVEIQEKSGKAMNAFMKGCEGNEKILKLREKVEAFAITFPMPGFEVDVSKKD